LFQLNGIVGGKSTIRVASGQSLLLQQIVINVKNGQKLILKDINFLFNNDAFEIKVEAQPSSGVFRARGGFGELNPNKVLFNNKTGATVIIFLLVSAVNREKDARSLSRSDSWHMTLQRVSAK
jgi:hypothetical protein